VNDAGRYQPELNLGLSISSRVHEQREGGKWGVHAVVTVSPAVGYVKGGSVAVGVGTSGSEEDAARRAAELREEQYQARLQVALRRALSARDPGALKVQRLLAGELTPHNMGVISDELMRGRKEGYRYRYGPKRLWSRFDKSINAPEVMGDSARHGGSSAEALKHIDPMQLAEAQAFIREVAERFLADVAGHPIPPFAP
jgi:hypothetical protein